MSINRAQAIALRERYLDDKGIDPPEGKFALIDEILGLAAHEFIRVASTNLDESNSTSTGELARSLTFQVVEQGEQYELSVGYPKGSKAAKYWDFNNKGVQGVNKAGKAPNSPYKFRYLGVSPRHALAILQWFRHNGKSVTNVAKGHPASGLEKKRLTLRASVKASDKLKSLAFATAAAMKREGLAPTGYFDKAVAEVFGPDLTDALQVALGAEVIVRIRKYKDDL